MPSNKSSPELTELAEKQQQQQQQQPHAARIEIVPGIDVTEHEIAAAKLQSFFRSGTTNTDSNTDSNTDTDTNTDSNTDTDTNTPIIPIHLLIHNAGAYGPAQEESVPD
jgi:hypothetical protein